MYVLSEMWRKKNNKTKKKKKRKENRKEGKGKERKGYGEKFKKWLAQLLLIREVPFSGLGPKAGYLD
jgi:hypothetical protein